MFLLACIGISLRLNIFLNQAFLAAHCLMLSIGNVRTVMAKNTRKMSFRKLLQHMKEYYYIAIVWSRICCYYYVPRLLLLNCMFSSLTSTNISFCPPMLLILAYLMVPPTETSEPRGLKNDEKQQTHITKAMVNNPSLPGLLDPVLSVGFLASTKLTSELFSAGAKVVFLLYVRFFEASLSALNYE